MANIARPPCDEAAILAGSCQQPATTNGAWILAATILGSSMAFIDGTVVNVALPALQSALGATLAEVQWVVESYALFLAALLLIGGSLGDRYGRRKIFAVGVVLFSAASAWCGLAPDIRQLIVARGAARDRRGAACPRQPGADQRQFFPTGARARDRHVVRLHVDHRGDRSRAGWMVHRARFVAMGVLHQSSDRAGVLLLAMWKVPESRADQQGKRFDWPGGVLAALGFGGIVYGLIESSAAGRRNWRAHADRAVVLGGAFRGADGSAVPVPLPQFQRSEPAHPLSLRRVERRSFLFPARFDTGARLLADAGGRRPAAFHFADVLVVALVRRTARSIWRQGSAGGWPPDRRRRIRAIYEARHRRPLLDHVLPRGAGAGVRHGDQRGAADHDGDERGRAELRGSGVGDQQRRLARRRFAGGGGFRSIAQRSFPERTRQAIGQTGRGAGGAGADPGAADPSWPPPKRTTRADGKRSRKHLSRAIAPCCGWRRDWRSPVR